MRIDLATGDLSRRLDDAADQLSDMSPLYGEIGEYMVEATRRRFQAGEAPDGTRWQPKKASTIEHYRRRGDGNRPDPLIGPSGRLGREINYLESRDGVEIGSSLIYSGVMQDGAAKGAFGTDSRGRPLPWGNIAARVWLGLSDGDERKILDIVEEHIASAVDGA